MAIGVVGCSKPVIFAVGLVWSAEEFDCTWLALVRSRSQLGTSPTLRGFFGTVLILYTSVCVLFDLNI
jgi:hypothetical protein